MFGGGGRIFVPLPNFLQFDSALTFSQRFDVSDLIKNDIKIYNSTYIIRESKTGNFISKGTLDENGLTERVFSKENVELECLIGDVNSAAIFHDFLKYTDSDNGNEG